MKKNILIVFFSCFFFAGCATQRATISEPIVQITGEILDTGPSFMTGYITGYTEIHGSGLIINIVGSTLAYNNLYTISLPKNIHTRTNEFQYYNNIRLDFNTDDFIYTPNKGYLKLYVEHIADWQKDFSDKDKCIFGKYDESIKTKNTSTKEQKNKYIYITSLTFSALETTREQGDICFVDNNLIYTISFGGYTKTHITSLVDSFTFID